MRHKTTMGNTGGHPLQYYFKPLSEAVPNPYLKIRGIFKSFRLEGAWPTLYPSYKTAVTVDVLEAGLILAFVMVAFCFFIILPGFRGRERLFVFIRVVLSLFLGACVILCNWGQEWEVGEITTDTQYKAFTSEIVRDAKIGVKFGLRNVNITLQAEDQLNETINYNERFWWSRPWHQGRFGFGPYSASISQEFRAAQYKGLPYPILWIAEYFTLDGEGIRWGRHYRTAGWYGHIMMWSAFPCWILANILFFININHGSKMLILQGFFQLLGSIIWAGIRNPVELVIPWETGKMTTHYGWSFVLNTFSGVLACLLGIFISICYLMDVFTGPISTFFGRDASQDYEEFYADDEPVKNGVETKKDLRSEAGASNDPPGNRSSEIRPQFRKRNATISGTVKKFRGAPQPPPRRGQVKEDEGLELYENTSGQPAAAANVVFEEKA